MWNKRLGIIAQKSLYVIPVLISFVILFPLIWMVLSSFKPNYELFLFPPTLIPHEWYVGHYIGSMAVANFYRFLLNSTFVTVTGVLLNLLFCSLAGYGFARLDFPGREILFYLVLATIMVPIQLTIIPLFIIIKNIPLAGGNNLLGQGGHGFLNSYAGLILPTAVTGFGIFLLRQFFLTLPKDLESAARIDGCRELGIYWHIVLPLSKPALIALAIFTFQAYWNVFIWPLVIIYDEALYTVQLGLAMFRQQYFTSWGYLLAATTVVTIPAVTIFIFLQRYFARGIAFTGIKG